MISHRLVPVNFQREMWEEYLRGEKSDGKERNKSKNRWSEGSYQMERTKRQKSTLPPFWFYSSSYPPQSFQHHLPCSCSSLVSLFPPLKLLTKFLPNWELVYVNHPSAPPPSPPWLLQSDFAVLLAAFESLVGGRRCRPQALSPPFFSLTYPHTATHTPWQLCCFEGVWWLISLYGDDTSCNEQEKAGMLISLVWEA